MKGNLIIAEFGSVHDGSFGNACKLIEAAANSGANVVKFQTHIAEFETLNNAPSPSYFKGEPRFEYFQRTSFSKFQWKELKNVCKINGVKFLSSPFSIEAVNLLEDVDVDLYKIPSGEVTNIPMLRHIGKTGKPVILSSGMSTFEELDKAFLEFKQIEDLTIMQCTSEYPCPPDKVGLNVLSEIQNRYKSVNIGFSDHYIGCAASFAAAALGAKVIEKHFTFSRLMYGSDASISMEPQEFLAFSQGLKDIWLMNKSPVDKNKVDDFKQMKLVFQKSIVAAKNIQAGEIVTFNDLAFKKPGDGIPANRFEEIIGKKLKVDVEYNHKFKLEDFI